MKVEVSNPPYTGKSSKKEITVDKLYKRFERSFDVSPRNGKTIIYSFISPENYELPYKLGSEPRDK
jgi:23S rRNA G2445 N2-methylase RlmL